MDWIRENKSLAVIVGIFTVASLALGYFLFDAWGAYTEKKEAYLGMGQQVAGLQSAGLAPNPANVKAKEALVAEFAKEVDQLGLALLNLQPRVDPMKNIDFQAKLKNQVAEARKAAQQARMNLPVEFAYGFEEYTSNLPSDAASTELSGYLDAMIELVNLFMSCGVESVDVLERSKLTIEGGSTKASTTAQPKNNRPGMPQQRQPQLAMGAPVYEKNKISAILTLDQGPLQLLIMKLATPSDVLHFTSLRLLRIENQQQEGPLRGSSPPTGAAPTSPDGAAAATEPAAADNAIRPPPPAAPDSVPIIGNEKIRVRLEIDLVKFLPAAAGSLASRITGAAPTSSAAPAAPGGSLPGAPSALPGAPAPAEAPAAPATPAAAPAAPAAQQ